MNTPERRAWLSWAAVGLLAVLCGVLALLQNNWIREISRAEKERLQNQLQTELGRLSREFNTEISTACIDLMPSAAQVQAFGREKAYSLRYSQWRESHDRMFSRIVLAVPQKNSLELSQLDLGTAQFSRMEWPSTWVSMRSQLLARLNNAGFDPPAGEYSTLIEMPRFAGEGLPGTASPWTGRSRVPRTWSPARWSAAAVRSTGLWSRRIRSERT